MDDVWGVGFVGLEEFEEAEGFVPAGLFLEEDGLFFGGEGGEGCFDVGGGGGGVERAEDGRDYAAVTAVTRARVVRFRASCRRGGAVKLKPLRRQVPMK